MAVRALTFTANAPYFGGWAWAFSSIAEALRWRAVGRCASQHATEQNISLMRPELHVDTEQRQYFEPSWIGLRHIEQTANDAMAAAYRAALRHTRRTRARI